MEYSTLPSPATKRYAQDDIVSYVANCPEARLEERVLDDHIYLSVVIRSNSRSSNNLHFFVKPGRYCKLCVARGSNTGYLGCVMN